MGGLGTGKRDGKRCTEDLRSLDVRQLKRSGLLEPGRIRSWMWTRGGETIASIDLAAHEDRVELAYSNRNSRFNFGEWERLRYSIWLDWTPCNLGGQRVWRRCPAADCGRRVAVLHGGRFFTCRECQDLVYRSQRETDDSLALRRANKIRRRLGWVPGIAHGHGDKPKGMHWHTFWRLQMNHDLNAIQAFKIMSEGLGVLERRLRGIDRQMNSWRRR